MENQNKLYRSYRQKMIGGVAGGLSEYFDTDVVVIRLLFVLLFLFTGGGLLVYIILWIVIPRRPLDLPLQTADREQRPAATSRPALAGIILIFLGVLFLFDNLTPWYHIGQFWPMILVLAGIFVMFPDILKSNRLTLGSACCIFITIKCVYFLKGLIKILPTISKTGKTFRMNFKMNKAIANFQLNMAIYINIAHSSQ